MLALAFVLIVVPVIQMRCPIFSRCEQDDFFPLPLLHLLLLLKDCGIRVVLAFLLLDTLQYLSFVAHFPRFFLHGMPRGMDQLLERLVSMGEVWSTVA